MIALKRRILDQNNGGRVWALYGQNGVISWELLKHSLGTTSGPIGIHSPGPQAGNDDEASDDCEFLEGVCYADAGYLAGDRLGRAWADAGQDDEVIWRELESWYTARLAGGAV